MNALRSRGSGPISPQDLNELSDYLNHAVCKQFDTLTVIRKFMTTVSFGKELYSSWNMKLWVAVASLSRHMHCPKLFEPLSWSGMR